VSPDSLLERLRGALVQGDESALHLLLAGLHASDLADLLEELEDPERARVVGLLAVDPARAADALSEMEPEEHPEDSLAALPASQLAAVIAQLADDDAADLIGELDPAEQDRVLATLPRDAAVEIRELMRHAEDTAGGLMTTELVAVRDDLPAADAIHEVRRQAAATGQRLYVVFVLDAAGMLRGWVPLEVLVTAEPAAPLGSLALPVPAVVGLETHQEEVARAVSRYNLAMIAVVDGSGRLVGGVTFDDVIDVIEDESTRDILGLGGTSPEEELRGGVSEAVRSRLPWLYANLLTAFMAAWVVYLFEHVVEQIALLAVCMPVIAGMGGNSGTQALAVTVRRLALSEGDAPAGLLVKELLVGGINGLATGVVAAAAALGLALLRGADPWLAAVVLMAMWVNLAVGGLAGALVPTVLERAGVDPAISSSIFVTAFTDMCGFFLLLGLAASFLI
jgi:magnesium transporter